MSDEGASTSGTPAPIVSTERARTEWHNRVVAEYRSAALASSLLHKAILAGFPEHLLHTLLRIVRDELDHAALSHEIFAMLGGKDAPIAMSVDDLLMGPALRADTVLPELIDNIVRDFCLGETFAVPLFQAMRRPETEPRVRNVLTRILADEAIHRQFGWDALDEMLAQDGENVRAHVSSRLTTWLMSFGAAYAPEAPVVPLSDEERKLGMIDLGEYKAIFAETIERDIRPRFERRGIKSGWWG